MPLKMRGITSVEGYFTGLLAFDFTRHSPLIAITLYILLFLFSFRLSTSSFIYIIVVIILCQSKSMKTFLLVGAHRKNSGTIHPKFGHFADELWNNFNIIEYTIIIIYYKYTRIEITRYSMPSRLMAWKLDVP